MSFQNDLCSVCLALIHNSDAHRYNYIKPALEQLRLRLSESFIATLLEVSIQPIIRPHSTLMAFLRDGLYRSLNREWGRYRRVKGRLLPYDVLDFLLCSLKKYFFCHGAGSVLANWKTSSFIETLVADKHIRAWCGFLESSADFLICFEDDAVFKDDSFQRVNELLHDLAQRFRVHLIYVDLAGGGELELLNVEKLAIGKEGGFRLFSKPVTNTACCYLLSRPLAAMFTEMITRRPWLRLIGIDWLMNKLFMLIADNGTACACMHASPPIFKHGSVSGEYVPWCPDHR